MKRSLLIDSDMRVLNFINYNLHCGFLNLFFKNITHLGGAAFIIGFSLLAFLVLPIQEAMKLFASVTISHLIVRFIKKAVGRYRPYNDNKLNTITPILKDYSFPSGHSASAVSLATSLAIIYPKFSILVFTLAFLVVLSRIYLGHHYPTDTLVGSVIGYTSSIIAFLL